jgi:hypothetical protein
VARTDSSSDSMAPHNPFESFRWSNSSRPQQDSQGHEHAAAKESRIELLASRSTLNLDAAPPYESAAPSPLTPQFSESTAAFAQDRDRDAGGPVKRVGIVSRDKLFESGRKSLDDCGEQRDTGGPNGSNPFRAPPLGVPKELGGKSAIKAVILVWDILLCLFPLSFLVLAGLTAQLKGKRVSPFGEKVAEWSLLGPTIFPIFFAAIVGRTMKFAAQWRLERGSSVESLEQLVGSQSVFGALMTQVVLQRFGLLSLGIIFVWAFSPLGGQASLRALSTEFRANMTSSELVYMNMTRQIGGFEAGYSQALSSYAINSIYTGCLVSGQDNKAGTMDSWNNVKIPKMELLDQNMKDSDGWIPIPSDGVTYSSLLGVPVGGIPKNANSTFNLRTYYYDIACQSLSKINATGDWLHPLNIPFTDTVNTSQIFGAEIYQSFYLSSYTRSSAERINGTDRSPMNLIFLSRSAVNVTSQQPTTVTAANCTLVPSFVESSVYCLGRSCEVVKMRRDTTIPLTPGSWWKRAVPLMTGYSDQFYYFTIRLAEAILNPTPYSSTPTEHYLSGFENFPFAHGSELAVLYKYVLFPCHLVFPQKTNIRLKSIRKSIANTHSVSLPDFSRRFGQIINTYWQASLAPQTSTGNLPSNISAIQSGQSIDFGSIFPLEVNTTLAAVSNLVAVYDCSWPWLALLVLSSLVLFTVGAVGTTMKYACIGPDVLGFVSSLVVAGAGARRGSHAGRWMGGNDGIASRGSSAMDGLERTRELMGVRVRLQDILEREDVGRVGVVVVDGRPEESSQLRLGRLYA